MRMLSPLTSDWPWARRSLSSDMGMGDVLEDFDRIFNSVLRPTYNNAANFQPTCDIRESKSHYLVSFDMPGVKKDDIRVEVQNNQLVVSGERQYEMKEEDGETVLRHERSYGKFERTFTLPTSINADKIEAHYENGVLSIALPKTEQAKGRTVQIQSGQSGFFSKLLGSKKEGVRDLKDVKVS